MNAVRGVTMKPVVGCGVCILFLVLTSRIWANPPKVIPASPENEIKESVSWNGYEGPCGYHVAEPYGKELITDFSDFADERLVWASEDSVPGGRMCSNAGNCDCPVWNSGYASPIVAHGDVFVSYYEPGGTVLSDFHVENCPFAPEKKWLIHADDIVVRIDGQTGKTVWRRVFEEKGINWNAATKTGPQLTPYVKGNRVYAIGTTGRVFCLDAADGTLLWESNIGPRHQMMEELKSKCLAEKKMFAANRDFMGNAYVAGRSLISMDFVNYKYGYDDEWHFEYVVSQGIVGLDTATGDQLWHDSSVVWGSGNAPIVWTYEGKEYVVAVDPWKGTLIDPDDGTILWQDSSVTGQKLIPSARDTLLVTLGGGTDLCPFTIKGFSLSPTGATMLWEHPATLYGDSPTSPLIHDGKVYFMSEKAKALVILDASTGEEIGQTTVTMGFNFEHDNGYLVLQNDLLFATTAVDNRGFNVYDVSQTPPIHLKSHGLVTTAVEIAYGYIGRLIPAFADGRLFVRMHGGRVHCYDLREGESRTIRRVEKVNTSGKKQVLGYYDLRGAKIGLNRGPSKEAHGIRIMVYENAVRPVLSVDTPKR